MGGRDAATFWLSKEPVLSEVEGYHMRGGENDKQGERNPAMGWLGREHGIVGGGHKGCLAREVARLVQLLVFWGRSPGLVVSVVATYRGTIPRCGCMSLQK